MVNEMEKQAYSEKKVEKNPWLPDNEKPVVTKCLVPTELLCPICKDLLKDAVMMPCCAGSACDECARNGIIDSEGSRCPVCADVANPEELIPYRLFRDKVDKFRNQTGYTKATHAPPAQQHLAGKPTLPDIVLPDPADLNFKFDALVGHRAAPGVKVEPPNLNFTLSNATNGSPSLPDLSTPITPNADSPHETSAPRQQVSPHTPTSTPPRSPGTPTSSPHRSRSRSQRSRSPGTPISPRNESRGRDTPTPTTSPQHAHAPLVDTSVPPPLYTGAPGPTLLPPGHVLAPSSHYPPPPPQLAPAPIYYHPQPVINPAEDPVAAFEAAMRKLDAKKADRGRLGPSSPPRAYRVERPRSRSRGRYRDYRDRDYSPHRRSPGAYRGHSPKRGSSPRRGDRGRSRGSGPRTPSPYSNGDSRNSVIREGRTASPGTARDYRGDSHGSMATRQRKERYVTDIPPETEEERRDRERFERELAERERYQKENDRDDQYSNFKRIERSKGRVAPTPPREFLEGEKVNTYREKELDNRTPSLSPEPGTDQHEEYMRRKELKQRDERDKDVRVKEEGMNYRDDKSFLPRDDDRDYKKSNDDKGVDHSKSKERSIDRSREGKREKSREERVIDDRKYDSRDRDVRDSRDKDVRDSKDRRDSRDRDVRDFRDKDVRDSKDRDVRDTRRDSKDRDVRDTRDKDVKDSRDRDVRDYRDKDVRDFRDRDVRDYRERDLRDSRDRDVRDRNRYHDREEWDRKGRQQSREVQERSREKKDRSRDRRDRSKENYTEDNSVSYKEERNGHKDPSEERVGDHEHDEKKESKKEKKAKKSKKKNKKKDKDSDDDEDGKETKKKKKKGKKKKDRDPESNDEDHQEEDVKPLVPYGENEDVKTTEESSENQEEKPPVDPTKFINSFSEAKAEEAKPKLNLPTLVFNEKTVELAPKEDHYTENDVGNESKPIDTTDVSQAVKSHDSEKYDKSSESKPKQDVPRERIKTEPEPEPVTNVVSKWDREDILTTEYPKKGESSNNKASLDSEHARENQMYDNEDSRSIKQEVASGPQNVLRKALANMEKDNFVRDKKRKSLEGSEPENDDSHTKKKKKKKKKKVETEEESSEEEAKEKTKKKTKKKKKGGLEIPEKTLKKLLKKNLLKKKALEKLISGEGKKKKKKTKDVEDTSPVTNKDTREGSSTERHTKKSDRDEEGRNRKKSKSKDRKSRLSGEERIVRRRDSHSGERRGEERAGKRGTKRDSSEEEREVKSSREGLIQVRLDNSSSRLGSTLESSRSSLTSTVQANLLKMAGQVDNGRKKEGRDRDNSRNRDSPPRKSIKDRLGPLSGTDSSPTKKVDRLERNPRQGEERLVRRTAALMAVKDRLGGSKERGGKDREERPESGQNGPKQPSARERLGAVPADLQAWALKATSLPTKNSDSRDRKKSESLNLSSEEDKKIVKRRRSISKEKRNNSRERKRNSSRERKRSNSREKRRETPSQERKSKKERKKEKKRASQDAAPELSPVKKRRNHRLTNEVDRSFNSDSD